MNHAAIRYLESKRSVDNRALSTQVTRRLKETVSKTPRILELGSGTGTTVPRLIEWGIDSGTYRGVDTSESIVEFARSARPKELRYQGRSVTESESGFVVGDLSVAFETGDAFEKLTSESGYDLIIGHAFADLVPPAELLSKAESALRPGGVAYFPITFDGETIFQPDHPGDQAVISSYHSALDTVRGRDSRAGRHLGTIMTNADGNLVGMEPSDWIVRPRAEGYPDDERYFLEQILGFFERALDSDSVTVLPEWLAERRRQLSNQKLLYVAHQYDLLYQKQK